MSEKLVKIEVKTVETLLNLGWFGKIKRYATTEFLGSHSNVESMKRNLNTLVSEGVVISYDFSEVNDTDVFNT